MLSLTCSRCLKGNAGNTPSLFMAAVLFSALLWAKTHFSQASVIFLGYLLSTSFLG